MNTRTLTWLMAGTLWLTNPIFTGCEPASEQDAFSFGEAELLDVLDDMNQSVWQIEIDGAIYDVTVDFTQQPSNDTALRILPLKMSAAYACGSRSFFAEASACLDVTSLPIEGSVSLMPIDSSDEPETFNVEGSLDVYGTTLNNADIWVQNSDFNAYWYGSATESDGSLDVVLNSVDRF